MRYNIRQENNGRYTIIKVIATIYYNKVAITFLFYYTEKACNSWTQVLY